MLIVGLFFRGLPVLVRFFGVEIFASTVQTAVVSSKWLKCTFSKCVFRDWFGYWVCVLY